MKKMADFQNGRFSKLPILKKKFVKNSWIALFGRYYITKRTRQIAANLAIYAAFLVVKIISIGHF